MFFFVLNEFANISEYSWIFSKFSYLFENTVFETIQDRNRGTVRSISQKSLECRMEYCFKNISTIRNLSLIFQNFEK